MRRRRKALYRPDSARRDCPHCGEAIAGYPRSTKDVASSGEAVAKLMRPLVRGLDHEEAFAVLVNPQLRVRRIVRISIGSLAGAFLNMRAPFVEAIRDPAHGVIFVHNHPSGDTTPSKEDRELTFKLAEMGRLLGIPLIDSVIVCDEGYFSFRDANILRG